jgi:hypothetical protein
MLDMTSLVREMQILLFLHPFLASQNLVNSELSLLRRKGR